MKKRIIIIYAAIAVIVALITGIPAFAAVKEDLKTYVNGELKDVGVKIIDGKLYAPVEKITSSLGAVSNFNQKTNILTITGGEYYVTDIVNKLSPSVVGIIGKIKRSSQDYSADGDNLVFGTGVIYKAQGYIITNAHVVLDMESIVVVLSNSKAYQARLKAIDEKLDLALIKIDKGGLTPAKFGKIDEIAAGEPVVAIGTPLSFSFRNSATKGIISGINRSADGENKFIQSDAAINGGNSGGPLVNMKGEVIGINSIKYAGFGVEGLSFSIPIDTVLYVLSHFEKYGMVKRPYLGVVFSEGVAARYGLPSHEGLTITEVEKDSPAETAGLTIDDEVTAVNGEKFATKLEYNEIIKKYLPGSRVELTIRRNGASIKLKVVYGEKKQ